MSRTLDVLDRVADEGVTLAAIGGLVYLGSLGVADPSIVAAVAGLGGYRLHKKSASSS